MLRSIWRRRQQRPTQTFASATAVPIVFISYAREDREFAQWLAAALEQQGLMTLADWKIPTGSNYKEWIARSIDDSTALLFVISEASVVSASCRDELAHAARRAMRLLPVVRRPVDEDEIPPELRLPNWLFFDRDVDASGQLLMLLRDARTDLAADLADREWRQRANHWESAGRPTWFIVAPSLARSARAYLRGKAPQAEGSHDTYLVALLSAYRRQMTVITGAVVATFAALAVTGVFGWRRSQEQVSQRALAEALALQRSDPTETRIPVLLAVESLLRHPSFGASELLATMLPHMSRPVSLQRIDGVEQSQIGVSDDDRVAMAAGTDGRVHVWDLHAGTSRVLAAKPGALHWAGLSRDGEYVVTSGADGRLTIWSVGQSSVERAIRLAAPASAVAFTPDLSRIVTGGASGTVELWDGRTGERLHMYKHNAAVTSVAVSVDGRWSAAGSEDGTGSVWDSRTRRHNTLQHWQRTVHDVLFWDERRTLVTASAAGDVRLWSLSGGDDPERRLNASGSSIVTKLALSDDRRTIASLSFATAVHVWDTATNTQVTSVHRAPTLVAMALSGDGTRVLTAGHDQQARLWDARTGNQLVSWKVQGHPTAVALSRFADTAVVATSTGAQVWRLGKPSRMAAFRHPTDVTRVALSGDGKVLAALSGGKVWLWNISSRRPIATVDHSSGMSDVALDGTGSAVAIAGESGVGAVYSVTDRRKLCELRTSDVQSAAAISSDGGTAVVGSWDGSLVWCNVSTGLENGRSSGASPVKSVVIVQSDGMLTTVVGRGDGSIESCHPGGPCEVIARQDAPIRRLAVAAAVKLIASSAPDARLRLWDWPRRRVRFDLPLLAFNTDLAASATTVLAASERGVQMFDSESGRETWRVERLGSVSSVTLSTAADRVVMAVGDQVLVVGTDTSELIAQACQHLSPVLSPEEWQKLLPGVRYRRACPEMP